MATKSFTRDFTFTTASADSLLKALNKDVTPKKVDTSDVTYLTDPAEIKAFFGKN